MRPPLLAVIAVLLAAGGQVEVWIAGTWRGPEPVDALVAASPLALAALRRRPVHAPLGMFAAYAADAAVFGSPSSITQFFALSIAVAGVAALAPPRAPLVALAGATALALSIARDPDDLGPGEFVFPFLFLALAWGTGLLLRSRERLAESLRDRAERLEAEQAAVARAAVLDERVRIARELHDVVAHGVSVMVVQAVAGRSAAARDPGAAVRAFDAIETTGQQSLAEMRRLLGVLRRVEEAPLLVPQPGLDQLEALVRNAREAGVSVALEVSGEPRPLPRGLDLSAYRIVQEALTNVVKHAGGAGAEVRLRYETDRIAISVADDGPGARGGSNGTGHGLTGMRERATLYGGGLRAGPRPGGGFEVRAWLPT